MANLSDSTWRNNNSVSLKELMADALKEMRISNQVQARKAEMTWKKMMGEGIARATQKVEYYKEKLVVTLDNAPLRHELSMGKEKIKEQLNLHLPADMQVKELILR